jgi:thioredoxin reductase (NADPH)
MLLMYNHEIMRILIFILASIFCLNLAHAEDEEYPVVVLGGGVAALTSATYLGRAGIEPLVISGPFVGGTLISTHSIQNWPGELDISGVDLSDKLQKQAQQNGATLYPGVVTKVDFSKRPFTITVREPFQNKFKTIKAQTCIIALGAAFNLLNVPGETDYFSRGVSTCAVCDGSLYKDRVVAIVGGGDAALTEAHYLSNIAKKVYIIVRGDKFRTVEEKRKADILNRPNIEVLYKTTVQSIHGDNQKVTHLMVQDEKKSKRELPVAALFLAIGSKPNTEIFRNQLELNEKGGIVLKNGQETSVPGVFAAGDIADGKYNQAVTAAGDAAKAALQAQEQLTAYVPKKQAEAAAAPEKHAVTEVRSPLELEEAVKNSKGPTFVYFSSAHCLPCRAFSLMYETWAKNFAGKIQFLKVRVDQDQTLANMYQLTAVPTLLIFDEKQHIVRKSIGTQEINEIDARLEGLKGAETIAPGSFKD